MEVKILHLYSKLMNIYGEYANVLVLKKHLEDQGFDVTVTKSESVKDVNFDDFDMFYIGSGTEKNQKQALADLLTKKKEIIEFYNKNKIALLTGNAFEMLGKTITDAQNNVFEGLSIADFTTVEQSNTRYTSDAVAKCRFLACDIVGFINKSSTINGISDYINEIKLGYGNDNNSKGEGIRIKNFFGTHLIGPVLVKNPQLMKYFIILIGESMDSNFKYAEVDYPYENSAYKVTLEKLTQRIEQTK